MKTLQRSSFGDWGKDLDDNKFACAIASLGICGSLYSAWPIPVDAKSASDYIQTRASFSEPLHLKYFIVLPEEWKRFTTVTSSKMLVELWELLKPILPVNPRFLLEFDDTTVEDYPGIKWLMGQVETAMGNGRLPVFYMPLKRSAGHLSWKWPICTGFYPDEESMSLIDQFRNARSTIDWMGKLTRIIELDDQGEESIDILFLPGGIKNARDLIVHRGKAIHANSVCIISTADDNEQNHWKYINNILQLTQASALFEVITDNFPAWASSFIRELSHDEPFDLALSGSQHLPGSRIMLWSVTEFITASSILKYCSDLLDNPLLRSRFGGTLNLPPHISNKLGLTAGPHSIEEIKHSIMDIGWLHEVGGASITVAVESLLRELQAKPQQFITYMAPPPPRLLSRMSKAKSASSDRSIMPEEMKLEKREEDQRYLQAGVSVRNQDIEKAFWRRQVNKISIHVGPPEKGKIRSKEVFRTDLLPETKADGHMLSVTFFEPDLMDQPEVAGLYLPKKGKSKPCVFNLFVPENAIKVEARIIVQYKNRILQNSILRGPAADYFHGDPYFSESTIETKPESLTEISIVSTFQVSRAIQDLEKRSRFDGAYLLNHNGETPGVYSIKDNESLYVRLDSAVIAEHVKQVEDVLDSCNWDLKEYKGLKKAGTTKLLRDLAWSGSALFQSVISRLNPTFTGNTAPVDGVPKKIQVVAANLDSRMPFEFIYDFTAPDEEAEICPNAKKILKSGKCKTCPYKDENPASVICPMGFWCMSRIIEWHAYSDELSQSTKNAPFLLKAGIPEDQGKLFMMQDPLVGYSNKVKIARDKSIDELKESFVKVGINSPRIVNSWADWRTSLKTLRPTLEVLLVHTVKDQSHTLIEIGDNTISALNLKGYLPKKTERPAIVLLLGCSTGTSQVQFQSVAALAGDCNAAIIVSTTSDVFGPIASKLAGYFIEQLGVVKSGQSFGDVMLAIRRKSLAGGIPMVLCLRTYGDADWQLVN